MSVALYRRYRPDTFQDVIGQSHVTEPIMAALGKGRINHAYLFSGPRGCGKTTSARILARCLNCAEGPTATPCGTCASCVELATGGPGSLDVIEIDAASHNGVDDARDLRERAVYAPARDRYKIFILDEAHMVTQQGFNALLKIVEEPPEHVIFIFATTEPEKVIGTIRSRTHHYPFRLVPPAPLLAYLETLCQREGFTAEQGVLPLTIRAGGGSVRDTLSVLDQLIAGAGTSAISYEMAVGLLGYTHATLLDDVIEAIAAGDSEGVFTMIDRVIQTGLDPRRFVEDLLERFRDLVVVSAVPNNTDEVLRGIPADQLERMRQQAASFGRAELVRAADVTHTALSNMTGATSPQLHLELLAARVLLPAADDLEQGLAARVDRIERKLSHGFLSAIEGNEATPAAPVLSAESKEKQAVSTGQATSVAPQESAGSVPSSNQVEREGVAEAEPSRGVSAERKTLSPTDEPTVELETSRKPFSAQPSPTAVDTWAVPTKSVEELVPSPNRDALSESVPREAIVEPSEDTASHGEPQHDPRAVEFLRRSWPDILAALAKIKRSSWVLVNQNATVKDFDGKTLYLQFSTEGLAQTFSRGEHAHNVQQAISTAVGMDCAVVPSSAGGGQSVSRSVPVDAPSGGQSAAGETRTGTSTFPSDQQAWAVPTHNGPASSGTVESSPSNGSRAADTPEASTAGAAARAMSAAIQTAEVGGQWEVAEAPSEVREQLSPVFQPSPVAEEPAGISPREDPFPDQGAESVAEPPSSFSPDDPPELRDVSPSDPELKDVGLIGEPVLRDLLGAELIDEYRDVSE